MLDSEEDGVQDDAQHNEEIEDSVVHHHVQHRLELEPRVVTYAAFPALGTVTIYQLVVIFRC